MEYTSKFLDKEHCQKFMKIAKVKWIVGKESYPKNKEEILSFINLVFETAKPEFFKEMKEEMEEPEDKEITRVVKKHLDDKQKRQDWSSGWQIKGSDGDLKHRGRK